jgi:molybdate transport system ATP-binding protein
VNEPILSFEITKRYPGFSLECRAAFEPGITAVFGLSGSGKTTLLNCLAGLVAPDEGTIEVLGETVFSSSPRRNLPPDRRRFGYVFQDAALFPHMSVWDNIRYGYRLTPVERRTTDLEQLVDFFQLADLLDRGVSGLSGGERQRVALARALATSPRVLLLDEPLASLDAEFQGLIIRYLRRTVRELDTPMVFVSHSMSHVLALAQSVLVLSDGKPVVQGRPAEVLAHPNAGAMAVYSTLENLVEAEVVSLLPEDEMAELWVGNARLSVPDAGYSPGDLVTISLRASDIILAVETPSKTSARNVVVGVIEEVRARGARVLVYIDIGARIVAEITLGALKDLGLQEGGQVYLIIKSASIVVLDSPSNGRRRDGV